MFLDIISSCIQMSLCLQELGRNILIVLCNSDTYILLYIFNRKKEGFKNRNVKLKFYYYPH